MKLKLVLGLLFGLWVSSLTLVALDSVDYTISDFQPPQGGIAPAAQDSQAQSGPWNQRLLTAISTDEGITWTKTNQIISDQADVPTAIIDAEGRIFVYFVTYYEPMRNTTVVAISEDNGTTWAYKQLDFGDYPARPAPTDPNAVLLEDGRIRLYFIRGLGQPPHLVSMSAISEDGIHFTVEEGVRLSNGEDHVVCAVVMLLDGQYHLFSPSATTSLVHGVSADGLTFTQLPDVELSGNFFMGKGWVETPTGYRVFAHQGSPDRANFVPSIASFITTDGITFTREDGVRLAPDPANELEYKAVRNPSVIRLPDGSLMMFYITLIAE